MTRSLIRGALSSRLHFSQNTVQQFEKDGFYTVAIGGDTWQKFYLAIQSQCMAHIPQLPGVLAVLLVGSDDVWRGGIGAECFQDRACFAEGLGAGAVDHDNKSQHPFGQDLPHEVKPFLTWRAEQVQDQ